MRIVKLCICLVLSVVGLTVNGQISCFATISDMHIGKTGAATTARKVVEYINRNDSVEFVLVTGDITDHGLDSQFRLAYNIISKLNKPYYVITGNHDTKFSHDNMPIFRSLFGSERFCFEHKGRVFIGAPTGPYPDDSKVTLTEEDIITIGKQKNEVILVTHHQPDLIKNFAQLEVKPILSICGHLHIGQMLTSNGIPTIVSPSSLRTLAGEILCDVIRVADRELTVAEIDVAGNTHRLITRITLEN